MRKFVFLIILLSCILPAKAGIHVVTKTSEKAIAIPVYNTGDTLQVEGKALETNDWSLLRELTTDYYLDLKTENTSIPLCALENCTGITGITIPNSVTDIGMYAFNSCSGLTGLIIPNSVKTISAAAFSNCSGITGVLTIPNSVMSVEQSAFYGCSRLTKVIIPNSLTSLKSSIFQNCSGLTELTIPTSITMINDHAFSGCKKLTKVIIEEDSTTLDFQTEVFENCPIETIYLGRNISNYYYSGHPFQDKTSLKSLTIGNLVTNICDNAFIGCSGLTEVLIPNSITIIGESAFSGCTGLTKLNIPSSVSTIKKSAFKNCSRLTGTLIIPNSVTIIGEQAFFGCSGFTGTLTIPNSVANIDANAFCNCSGFTKAIISNSVKTIDNCAFENCSGLKEVNIPNSVTYVGQYAFYKCTGLSKVIIEDGLSTLNFCNYFTGALIFRDCPIDTLYLGRNISYYSIESPFKNKPSIKSLTIGDYVTSINDYAFTDCSGLVELIIPSSITYIGKSAFYQCNKLKGTLIIPESVTSIQRFAFFECKGITELFIPERTTSIEEHAFSRCENLIKIHAKNPIPPKTEITAFERVNKENCMLYVPERSIVDYSSDTVWKDFFKIEKENFKEYHNITFNIPSKKTYGDAELMVNVYSDSGFSLYFESSNPNVAEIRGGKIYIKNIGSTYITASAKGDTTYYPTSEKHLLTVNKAPLTITANNKHCIYGEPIPELTISYNGFVNNENESVLNHLPDITCAVTETSPAGVYDILLSAIEDNNYDITLVNGTLTIYPERVEVEGIQLNTEAVSLNKDSTYQLTATVLPVYATNRGVVWSSSNTSIATVDTNGLVTAIAEGSAFIRATTVEGGFADSCAIIVLPSPFEITLGSNSVTITWQKDTNAETYVLILYSDEGKTQEAGRYKFDAQGKLISKSSLLSYSVEGLTPKTQYYYTLTAYDENEEEIIAHSGDFTTQEQTTDIIKITEVGELNIYPNPANHYIRIDSDYKIDKVELYNNLGQIVLVNANSYNKIDVSTLTNGVYIVRIYSNSGITTKRIVIKK